MGDGCTGDGEPYAVMPGGGASVGETRALAGLGSQGAVVSGTGGCVVGIVVMGGGSGHGWCGSSLERGGTPRTTSIRQLSTSLYVHSY